MVQLWQQRPQDDLSWQGDSEGIQGLFGGIRSPRQGFRVWDLSRNMVFTAANSQGPVPEFPLYNINCKPLEQRPTGGSCSSMATRRAPLPPLFLEFYWGVWFAQTNPQARVCESPLFNPGG